jgi:hypothetical protein
LKGQHLKYLGTNLKNQNSIQEEIKSRLKSGNACCNSVQNLLSSTLQFRSIKIKIYRTLILRVVLHECKTWSHTLREEHKLKKFDRRVPMKEYGPEEDGDEEEVT